MSVQRTPQKRDVLDKRTRNPRHTPREAAAQQIKAELVSGLQRNRPRMNTREGLIAAGLVKEGELKVTRLPNGK
jgi:hypothetical protein